MKKLLAVLVLTGAVVMSGCGGLSGSSTCSDFSNASPEEQAEAISSLSSEHGTPEYTSPLGSPQVGFYCASNPDTTLDEFFEGASD